MIKGINLEYEKIEKEYSGTGRDTEELFKITVERRYNIEFDEHYQIITITARTEYELDWQDPVIEIQPKCIKYSELKDILELVDKVVELIEEIKKEESV